jgi:hypothetical protein
MKIENVFKRYLKEAGIFASSKSKKAIIFMKEYSDVISPFNSFRWDITEEGYLFWYERALNWCIFLYNNYDNIEGAYFDKWKVAKQIRYMLLIYLSEEEKENVKKLKCYNDANSILGENGIPIHKID